VLTNIDSEYTKEEIMEYIEAELPLHAIKPLNKKIRDEEAHIKYVPSKTILITFRGQYTPQKVRLFYNQLTVHNYKHRCPQPLLSKGTGTTANPVNSTEILSKVTTDTGSTIHSSSNVDTKGIGIS
jgi:hypothetical protein